MLFRVKGIHIEIRHEMMVGPKIGFKVIIGPPTMNKNLMERSQDGHEHQKDDRSFKKA